jgi:hypothetical protein
MSSYEDKTMNKRNVPALSFTGRFLKVPALVTNVNVRTSLITQWYLMVNPHRSRMQLWVSALGGGEGAQHNGLRGVE